MYVTSACLISSNEGKITVLVLHECTTSAEQETTYLGWQLYPLIFFEQYRYGNLAQMSLWCITGT